MTFLTSPDYDAPAGVVASMIRALTRSCKAKIAHSENADGHAGDWGFELAGTTAFALGHSLHCNITPAIGTGRKSRDGSLTSVGTNAKFPEAPTMSVYPGPHHCRRGDRITTFLL